MTDPIRPIRRVVTGNDAQGRSRVLFDSAAPNVNPGAVVRGTCMTDIWVYRQSPAPIAGERDDGNLPFHFEPPPAGGGSKWNGRLPSSRSPEIGAGDCR